MRSSSKTSTITKSLPPQKNTVSVQCVIATLFVSTVSIILGNKQKY